MLILNALIIISGSSSKCLKGSSLARIEARRVMKVE